MDIWWIDEPNLLGSSNPTDATLQQLREDGFAIVVSLLRADEQSPAYSMAHATALGYKLHTIPVKDYSPPTIAQLEQFVELVRASALDTNVPPAKIVVHCQGGIGRTGTFAAAHWITKGFTAPEAIAHVRQARPHAVETEGQEEILREFERSMQVE